MVRQVVEQPFDAQVEHERGARESLTGDPAVRPPAAQVVGHKAGHRLGEVGVDDQGVGGVGFGGCADSNGPATLKQNLLGLIPEHDLDAHLAGDASHTVCDCCRSRRSGDRRRARTPGTTGSKRDSGNDTATSPGTWIETRRPGECVGR